MHNKDFGFYDSRLGIFRAAHDKIIWRERKTHKSEKDYNDHLEANRLYCGKYFLPTRKNTEEGFQIYHRSLYCKSWDCPQCRKIKAYKLKEQFSHLLKRKNWRFACLTFPTMNISREEALQKSAQCWDVFLKRLRRRFGAFSFVWFLEFTAKGYPHYHFIVDRYIFKHILSQVAVSSGFGYVAHIKQIPTRTILNYVLYYVGGTKQKHAIHNWQYYQYKLRRFGMSQDIKLQIQKTGEFMIDLPQHKDLASEAFENLLKCIIAKYPEYDKIGASEYKFLCKSG